MSETENTVVEKEDVVEEALPTLEDLEIDSNFSNREKVRELIRTGRFTKAQIATILDISIASVNSNLTYLRWGDLNILWDSEGVLRFGTKEEFEIWETERKANSTSKAAPKDPQARANALVKTITRQEKQLVNVQEKLQKFSLLDEDDITEDIQDAIDEAGANQVLLTIKIKRNKAFAATLPEPEVEEVVETTAEVATVVEEAENIDFEEEEELI